MKKFHFNCVSLLSLAQARRNLLNVAGMRQMSSQPNSKHAEEALSSSSLIGQKKFINPDLHDFIRQAAESSSSSDLGRPVEDMPDHAYLQRDVYQGHNRKVYIDIYGCQMNVSDVEIVWSVLLSHGFIRSDTLEDANVVLLMTCAIREGAEQKIWNRLNYLKHLKARKNKKSGNGSMSIGVLGCMAERLKHKLVETEQSIDIVAGPDSYRDLPRLLADVSRNPHQSAVNVLLSLEETYADIVPVRIDSESASSFVSIMRGCDNMCSYCIVPFTRGRERSRPVDSILDEVRHLADQGVREVTLLGQNVNSYRDLSESTYFGGIPPEKGEVSTVTGFKTVYKAKQGGRQFSDLLDRVSLLVPEMRIRFTSPHPKDFPDEVLQLVAERPNICKNLHLPAQSGNNEVLERMNRGYTRESYLQLIDRVRGLLPEVSISSDFICGFCGETNEEFEETVSLVEAVAYQTAYIFQYSMREKTKAHRRFIDDVPQETKTARVDRLVEVYRKGAEKLNQLLVGTEQLVLVEGVSKRSASEMAGRCESNVKAIMPQEDIRIAIDSCETAPIEPGSYVAIKITSANSQVMRGIPLYHTSIKDFATRKAHQKLQLAHSQ